MSLTHRRPRPLRRDPGTFRDDRLFIVACDDTYAPKQYFEFLSLPRVQIHVVVTEDGTSAAHHVLNRLRGIDHDEGHELWMLLDTDHCITGTHLQGFTDTLQEAKRQGVHVALSRPSFEIWLLLHHVEEEQVTSVEDASDAEARLREHLGQYNKTRLKAEHYPIESVCDAYTRAERLDSTVAGGDIPSANTTRVYQLVKAIATKALPSQLPPALRMLL